MLWKRETAVVMGATECDRARVDFFQKLPQEEKNGEAVVLYSDQNGVKVNLINSNEAKLMCCCRRSARCRSVVSEVELVPLRLLR